MKVERTRVFPSGIGMYKCVHKPKKSSKPYSLKMFWFCVVLDLRGIASGTWVYF